MENLNKLTRLLGADRLITAEDVQQILLGIMEILKTYKQGTESINEETKQVVNSLLEQTIKYNQETISDFKSEADKAHAERMKELQGFLSEVKTTLGDMEVMMSEVKDGKDADEEKIVEDVINRIKIDPTVVTMSAEEVRDKLASLKEEDRLDKSAIKGLEKVLQQKDLDYVVATLQQQASFLINKGGLKNVTAGTNVTIDYTDPSNPVISSTGGSGSGDVTGPSSSTDNAITRFDGTTGKLIQNSLSTIDDTGILSTTSVRVTGTSGSGDVHLRHQASDPTATGQSTSLFADSNGDIKYKIDGNFYTTLKTSSNTADRTYTYPDATGNLALKNTIVANQIAYAIDTNTFGSLDTATYPSLTELSYVKGVTSAIQTQLNAKGAGTVTQVTSANADIGIATTTTTPVLTLNSATAGTASTIVKRDSNGLVTTPSFIEGYTTTATAAGTTTLTVASNYIQVFTGSTTQTVTLPTTGVAQGQQYYIINKSSGLVTVQSSGANTVIILGANTEALLTANVATPTTAANWNADYFAANAASGKVATINNTITFAGTDGTTMTFPSTSATIARTDAANTFTGVQTMTSPAITTSITTASTSFTAFAGATTLLTIGGTGASASLFAPSTLDTTSSTTGAIRTSGGISAAKAGNIGTTLTVGASIKTGFTTTATAAGTTTLTIASTEIQVFTGTTTQTVLLPTTSVLAGARYTIENRSTGNVTVQSSGENTVQILGAGMAGTFTALVATPTTAANWICDLIEYSGLNVATTMTANAATVNLAFKTNSLTNNSAATMSITIPTAGAIDGETRIVRIYDFSAVAQTINWTNTQNSTDVSVPTTSNGSTTLPLTVGFQYNGASSLWRCIAKAA